jgi:hypothetical protein
MTAPPPIETGCHALRQSFFRLGNGVKTLGELSKRLVNLGETALERGRLETGCPPGMAEAPGTDG